MSNQLPTPALPGSGSRDRRRPYASHLSRTCVQRPCIRFVLRSGPILSQPGQLVKQRGEVVRQGTLHGHPFPGARVEEGQPPGVEALADQAGIGLFGPIHRVPQNGMADGGQVDPDLVGAAGLQAALEMGIAGKTAAGR